MAERRDPVRLSDVALRAGVSLATVSRSMTGASGVSPAVAERVRAVADDMGYVANPLARSLAGGRSMSIGLIVSDISDPYFSEIARGAIDVAASSGRSIQICHASSGGELLAQIALLRLQRVGAIIVAGSGHVDPALDSPSEAALESFREQGGRLAVIGRHHLAADAVLPDNVEAGRTLGRHLRELGHERVAVIAGPAELTAVSDRVAGLRDELGGRIVGISHHEFSRAGGVAGAERLLAVADLAGSSPLPLTAVVAANDVMAVGVLSVLRDRGIAVPEGLSVVGCDDIDAAADAWPGLTTVRLPMAEFGAEAVRLVLSPAEDEVRRVVTGHELVVRGSTAAPRLVEARGWSGAASG